MDQLVQADLDVLGDRFRLPFAFRRYFSQEGSQRVLDQDLFDQVSLWQAVSFRNCRALGSQSKVQEEGWLLDRHRTVQVSLDDEEPTVQDISSPILDDGAEDI